MSKKKKTINDETTIKEGKCIQGNIRKKPSVPRPTKPPCGQKPPPQYPLDY